MSTEAIEDWVLEAGKVWLRYARGTEVQAEAWRVYLEGWQQVEVQRRRATLGDAESEGSTLDLTVCLKQIEEEVALVPTPLGVVKTLCEALNPMEREALGEIASHFYEYGKGNRRKAEDEYQLWFTVPGEDFLRMLIDLNSHFSVRPDCTGYNALWKDTAVGLIERSEAKS